MLAIVIGTCDKHSFLWNGWWHYFKKNFEPDYPVYFLTETKIPSFPVKTINVNIPDVNLWTKRMRESIKQIPEKNIFWLCEDYFITTKFEKDEFENIYNFFIRINADSLRISFVKCKYITTSDFAFQINKMLIEKLNQDSKYLISYLPSIWKKSFLLECLKVDESPWDSEIKGSQRIENKSYDIYSCLKLNWYKNACRQGKLTPEGEKLLNYESYGLKIK